jgi:hypothetical protein
MTKARETILDKWMKDKEFAAEMVLADIAMAESEGSSIHVDQIFNARDSDLVDVHATPTSGQWIVYVKTGTNLVQLGSLNFAPMIIVADTKEQAEQKAACQVHELMDRLIAYWNTLEIEIPTGTDI